LSWSCCQLSCLLSELLLHGSLSGFKLSLKLSSLLLCFFNSLDVLSILVDCWVLLGFLLLQSLFLERGFSCLLGLVCFFLGSSHLRLVWEQLLGCSCKGCCLVGFWCVDDRFWWSNSSSWCWSNNLLFNGCLSCLFFSCSLLGSGRSFSILGFGLSSLLLLLFGSSSLSSFGLSLLLIGRLVSNLHKRIDVKMVLRVKSLGGELGEMDCVRG
jgi:hypothetical protein